MLSVSLRSLVAVLALIVLGMPRTALANGASVSEVSKLTANDWQTYDYFGSSVSISGNLAIVGAVGQDAAVSDAGAAYIYRTTDDGASWTQVSKLTANDGQTDDYFGRSVSISGNLAIVGAYGQDQKTGAAYIYRTTNDGASWTQVSKVKLTANDGQSYRDYFGYSVSISGNLAIVGAYGQDALVSDAGAAYIYRTTDDGASWSEVKKVTANDGQTDDYFGRSVSISGNLAIVGAYGQDAPASDAGAAYIYRTTDDGASWTQVSKLTANDGQTYDHFGLSVSISGNLAIVGAGGQDQNTGAAYIYRTTNDGASWTQVSKLKLTANDGQTYDYFGYSVSISGNLAIVGAFGQDALVSDAGAAYIYRTTDDGASWSEVKKVTANDGQTYDYFGLSVSISGNLAIVGAEGQDAPVSDAGAAYIYIDHVERKDQSEFGRSGGLPKCECNVFHNGAHQSMSRMCMKTWGNSAICYPSRFEGTPGTERQAGGLIITYDNWCDSGQSLCSPWP